MWGQGYAFTAMGEGSEKLGLMDCLVGVKVLVGYVISQASRHAAYSACATSVPYVL